LGLTSDESPYVYLSDGGHFENFGLYKMVRRRCRWIVVCDGAEDRNRTYEDLGNAVRKIWIDLGVRVSFDASLLLQADKATKPLEMPYFALGTIDYVSDGPLANQGKILYIKLAVRGDESAADVIALPAPSYRFPAAIDRRTMVRRVATRILSRARVLDHQPHSRGRDGRRQSTR
jgi:hypothetical protein